MTKVERVDVLMPTFRAGRYFRPAAISTLRSMGKYDRLLIHMDGSDSQTEQVLQGIDDSRVIVSGTESNHGVWASLNALATFVDADYVARMDSDDVCLPWRFSFQKHFLRKLGLDLAFSSAVMIRSSGRTTMPRFVPIRGGRQAFVNPARSLPNYNPLFTSSSFMNFDTFNLQTPFVKGFEDYKSWLKCCIEGKKLAVSLLPMIAYRMQPLQISSTSKYMHEGNSDPELAELQRRLEGLL